jgi:site-specific recombinase XerD
VRVLRKVEGFVEQPTIDTARAYLGKRRSAGVSAATLYTDARPLKNYSRWWAKEHDVPDPLARLPYPKATKAAPGHVAQDDAIDAVLRTMAGPGFEARRNTAIVWILRDTGMRRSEVARLNVADVEFDNNRLHVTETKNGEERYVPMSNAVRRALTRYLMERDHHPRADDAALFIGRDGALRIDTLGDIVTKAAKAAGVKLTAHTMRRRLAHEWVKGGGSDDLLMHIAGWKDYRMPGRYRAEVAKELAVDQYRQIIDRPEPVVNRSRLVTLPDGTVERRIPRPKR